MPSGQWTYSENNYAGAWSWSFARVKQKHTPNIARKGPIAYAPIDMDIARDTGRRFREPCWVICFTALTLTQRRWSGFSLKYIYFISTHPCPWSWAVVQAKHTGTGSKICVKFRGSDSKATNRNKSKHSDVIASTVVGIKACMVQH